VSDEPGKTSDELARQLWAIGDVVRLRLLSLLPTNADCDSGNNVSRLAEELGLSQPTVSHHLRVLRQAGLVLNRKMCRDVYYWVDADEAGRVVEALRDAFVSNDPDARTGAGGSTAPQQGGDA